MGLENGRYSVYDGAMKTSYEALSQEQDKLVHHPLYAELKGIKELRTFMEFHVFAVWDFMSLLKSLQRSLTTVTLPWKPSPYSPAVVRLINEIVLGEESDVDQDGIPSSHFELYLKGMEEVGASTTFIRKFLATPDYDLIPEGAREFVKSNVELSMHGDVVEVAAAFFYGREKLIPEMFTSITHILKQEKIHAPTFCYYLERHIQVDGEEHGPLAQSCLQELVGGSKDKEALSIASGLKALKLREELWNHVHQLLLQPKID